MSKNSRNWKSRLINGEKLSDLFSEEFEKSSYKNNTVLVKAMNEEFIGDKYDKFLMNNFHNILYWNNESYVQEGLYVVDEVILNGLLNCEHEY